MYKEHSFFFPTKAALVPTLLLGLLLSQSAAAQPTAAELIAPSDNLVVEGVPPIPRTLAEQVQRYTEFRSAVFADWHPQRREMLISTRFADAPQLHRVLFPGAARTQLTFFSDRISDATYQPTVGDYFVFRKDVGGGEWFQFYRYDEPSRQVTLLTDGKSRNTGGVFSQRGDLFAYMSTRRTGQDTDLWIINPRDPKSDRLLLALSGGGWEAVDWSADDSQILLLEELSINESYLWLVDVKAGQKRLLTARPTGEKDKVAYHQARFSHDKKGIYVTTDRDGEFQRLAYLDLATATPTYLTTAIPWDVERLALSPDGKSVAFSVNENGISRLYVLDTATSKFRPLAGVPVGVIGGLTLHRNGVDLGFTLSGAQANGDAYSMNIENGKLDRWTSSETGSLNPSDCAEPQLIKWQSFDGRQISGFLYQPPKRFAGKRPVIINIHGGPEGQSRPGFIGRNNYYLNELGVALLFPNIRGSSGYGKTFLKLDNGFARADSYRDLEALYKWVATQPSLDAGRIMVTGGSYGGHMTLVAATQHSKYIRAALAVVGMSNLVTFLERTEGYRRDLRRVEYGDERDPKMRQFLTGLAPLSRVGDIQKPLFVVQGKNDPRVPVSEAEQIVSGVRAKGVPIWYLLAKDEGHGFAKKRNQDFQFYASVRFIQEFLLK